MPDRYRGIESRMSVLSSPLATSCKYHLRVVGPNVTCDVADVLWVCTGMVARLDWVGIVALHQAYRQFPRPEDAISVWTLERLLRASSAAS